MDIRLMTMAVLLLQASVPALAADLAELKKRGVIRVVVAEEGLQDQWATDPDLPPGFEREIMDLFANLHDLDLEVVIVGGVAQKYAALQQGRADLIASSTVTDDRQELFDYSDTVFPARFVAVNRSPSPLLETVEQLRGARVGAIRASAGSRELLAAGVPEENIEYLGSTPEVMEAMRAGRVSAGVTTSLWAFSERKRDPDLQIGVPLGPPTGTAFAIPKNCPELLAALNEILLNVRRSGKWNHLVVQYFGADALKMVAALHAR